MKRSRSATRIRRDPESRAFGKALAGLASQAPAIEIFDATAIALPGRRRNESTLGLHRDEVG